ncbi:MAG: RidA family protein, partial [Gammaproteobacteria bacterium]|nr:RidA family protein [Gammaproteobacteria bacterium]
MSALERLAELGLELPPAMRIPGQKFETVHVSGSRITIAGHLPFNADGKLAKPLGKVGAEVDADEAYQAARQVALGMLASLQAAGVDLDRVEWRKAFGMVNAAPGFNALPGVINGFSELLLDVFGERGRHSRSAIGVAELPFGAPVEVEAEAVLLPVEGADGTAPAPTQDANLAMVGATAETTTGDPGLRLADYAGISPLSIPAEALVRSIESLSNLFWISIGGTVVTVFLAALVNLVGTAEGVLPFGEFHIPLSVLPIACLAFAMFLFWLTA